MTLCNYHSKHWFDIMYWWHLFVLNNFIDSIVRYLFVYNRLIIIVIILFYCVLDFVKFVIVFAFLSLLIHMYCSHWSAWVRINQWIELAWLLLCYMLTKFCSLICWISCQWISTAGRYMIQFQCWRNEHSKIMSLSVLPIDILHIID